MEFFSFHLTPWPHLPAGYVGPAWIRCPNERCVPVRGHDVYDRYLDELAYAEQLGVDGRVVNEHHRFLGPAVVGIVVSRAVRLYFFHAREATTRIGWNPYFHDPNRAGRTPPPSRGPASRSSKAVGTCQRSTIPPRPRPRSRCSPTRRQPVGEHRCQLSRAVTGWR